jgi:hypothetical protein
MRFKFKLLANIGIISSIVAPGAYAWGAAGSSYFGPLRELGSGITPTYRPRDRSDDSSDAPLSERPSHPLFHPAPTESAKRRIPGGILTVVLSVVRCDMGR